ncbi:MAG: hypothetical protein JNM96_08325 [Bacteroidia bacterium]|nr:hypothetical protein [Bacteroidia bacterium]
MKQTVLLIFVLSIFKINAQDTVKVAVNLSPDEQAQQDYNNGLALMAKNDFNGAVDLLTKSINLKPGFEKAYYNRCVAYTSL